MHGLRGNGAREKTASMPDPLWRSSCGSLRACVVDMDMVRPWKDPWELSQSLWPWEAWAVLTDLCARSLTLKPPRSSGDAYVGRLRHCLCGGDHRSRNPLRLVWVNGSFGC